MKDLYSYDLQGICSLWHSWIESSPGAQGFEISEAEAELGWYFIKDMTLCAMNESTTASNDFLFYLKNLIKAWRKKASTSAVDSCLKDGVVFYLKRFKEYQKKKKEHEQKKEQGKLEQVKAWQMAVLTGVSLLYQYLDVELNLEPDCNRVSGNVLEQLFYLLIPMMEPDPHKNKENRKYNRFFQRAAEASGKILQCMRNLSAADKVSADKVSMLEKKLVDTVQGIHHSNSAGDQLVTALKGICNGYQFAGKLLYKYALGNLTKNGVLLNCVQDVLIAYTACLLREKESASSMPTDDEWEKEGHDLVTHLMPKLATWLTTPDPVTRKLTLKLLTGRAHMLSKADGHGNGNDESSSGGLLEFIDESNFGTSDDGLNACLLKKWDTFTSSSCDPGLRQVRRASEEEAVCVCLRMRASDEACVDYPQCIDEEE
jgi:hypothetical protein